MVSEHSGTVFRDLEIGDVVTALFPQHHPVGREQEGYRPAVVVGIPSLAGSTRFDVVLLAPFTSDRNQQWATTSPRLYPRFPSGTGNLRSASICLLDQIRSLDKRRVVRRRGRLDPHQFGVIRRGLLTIFGQSTSD